MKETVALRIGGKNYHLTAEEAQKLSGLLQSSGTVANGSVMYYSAGHYGGTSGTIVVESLTENKAGSPDETDC